FSKGEEDAILKKAKSNVLLSQIIEVLKKEADKELNSVPQKFIPDAQLLAISREQIKRLVTLSMAYRLFKDSRYAKKAEEELINVCKFPSWHPEHFLDDAEMTTAVAIGYDWCYNYLSPAARLAAENAIRENGFKPAWPIYERTDKTPFNRENNWNMVCNSGMLNGAIAIGDKYPDDLNRILQYAVKNTPNLLESFAPEGVFNEGPGYWSYNGMYMALFFDNLKRNIHNDYGLPNMKGINNTAHFYTSIIGPAREPYNFGDASEHFDYSGTFFLLSKLYHQPEIAEFYRNAIEYAIGQYRSKGDFSFPRFFFLAIPWFDDAKVATSEKTKKLEIFNGVTDFIIMNGNDKADSNRLYLAAKTGKPSWSHNQLDVGSFIVESDGERWGIDLGADSYSLPNFWDYKPGGVRWNYFRNTNMAHNTLTIDDKITNSDGVGELIRSNKGNAKPFGIFDMSTSYEGQVSSVLRGFKLLSQDAVLIRDEITLKPGSKKVSWRFLTNAGVKIDGSTATLSQNGKKFYINCLLTDGFTIKSFPAKTNTPDEKPIKDVTIIEITVSPSKSTIAIPVLIGKDVQSFKTSSTDNSALSTWR
ncbi:MAG: heparinase II/III family protein, partial [Segetibacter sp.]|nr:heparinase II/III family protein [Segetibacter sp.]